MNATDPAVLCKICGAVCERRPPSQPLQTCSKKCLLELRSIQMRGNKIAAGKGPNTGSFKPGLVPWIKGKKGLHLSAETEFKPGIVPANKLPVGSVQVRTRKRDGQQRAWVKIAEPNVWRPRAVAVWESANGRKVPKGCVVHHVDRNPTNDAIDNLELKTRADHLREHRDEIEPLRLAALKPLPV